MHLEDDRGLSLVQPDLGSVHQDSSTGLHRGILYLPLQLTPVGLREVPDDTEGGGVPAGTMDLREQFLVPPLNLGVTVEPPGSCLTYLVSGHVEGVGHQLDALGTRTIQLGLYGFSFSSIRNAEEETLSKPTTRLPHLIHQPFPMSHRPTEKIASVGRVNVPICLKDL